MANAKSEPFYAEVRATDREFAMELVSEVLDQVTGVAADIKKAGGLYIVTVAETAEPTTS
jgi:hypothetical protein